MVCPAPPDYSVSDLEPLDPAAILGQVVELDEPARLRAALWEIVDSANKTYSKEIVCEHHPKYKAGAPGNYKHRVTVEVPDLAARVKAIDSLLDRLEGRPGAQPAKKPTPKVDPSKMDELSDEALDAIIAAGGVGSTDG